MVFKAYCHIVLSFIQIVFCISCLSTTAFMLCPTAHCFSLRGNSVGMEGAKALANALKTNRSLKSLK